MTVPLRGWARPRSAAARLAACEQLIGHEFSNLDLLKQALDSRGSSSKRLAVIGDRAVETHLAHRWWKKKDLSGTQWNELRTNVLCNENLSNVGFRMGLHECTIPDSFETNMKPRMATTIEALLAAVWLDTNRDAAAFDKVIDRLGLTHTLLDSGTTSAWWHSPITSSRMVPHCFFSGHHISPIKALSELEQPMVPPRGSTSRDVRLAAGNPSPKQKAEPKKSKTQKPVSTDIRTEVEQLYMRIEEDAMGQLSRQVPQSKQPNPKVPSDDVEQKPESYGSVEQDQENAVQSHVTRDQVTKDLDSFDLGTKKNTEDAKQTVHDQGPLYRVKSPKAEESVERDPPSETKADPGKVKRPHVQNPGPSAHQETGVGGETSFKKGSKRDVIVDQGQKPSEGNPEKNSSTQDKRSIRKQEIQALEKRVQKLINKQRANPSASRLAALDEVIAQLNALKESTVEV